MTISVGDSVPTADLVQMGADGPESTELGGKLAGRKVVIFGLPGAFTGTCTTAHVPSFMRTFDAFSEKGVDEIICVSVNDPFVMSAWSDQTGAGAAGISMLGDASGAFTASIGMNFDAPPVGLYGRSRRYAMYVENGTVKVLNVEENPGVCETSAGEALLEQI
ncbi:MAG: peroxiredoxin [Pseudomonadota bacterium]